MTARRVDFALEPVHELHPIASSDGDVAEALRETAELAMLLSKTQRAVVRQAAEEAVKALGVYPSAGRLVAVAFEEAAASLAAGRQLPTGNAARAGAVFAQRSAARADRRRQGASRG